MILDRRFWPEETRHPILRLTIALIAAPALLGAIITMIAFLFAGLSAATRAGALASTSEAALEIFSYLLVSMPTIGLIGIGCLWALRLRSALAWTVTGALGGAVVAVLQAIADGSAVDRMTVLVFALVGWALFLMIRWIAGIGG